MSSQLTEATSDEAASESGGLGTDEIFHVLQNERRRNVLRYLRQRDGAVPMREIAEQVAAWEHGTTVEQLSSEERQRVYIPLYQSHLPKLDDVGAIRYQQDRGIVEKQAEARVFDPYLDAGNTRTDASTGWDPTQEEYYIAITALGGIILLGGIVGVPVLSVFSGLVIALILLTLVTLPTAIRMLKPSQPNIAPA